MLDTWYCPLVPTYGSACKVDMKVISHYLIVTLFLDLLGYCFTHWCGRGCACTQSNSNKGCILGQVEGSQWNF